MTRVLVLGAVGALGTALCQYLTAKKNQFVLVRDIDFRKNTDFDLSNRALLHSVLDSSSPDIIFNCTGRFKGSLEEQIEVNFNIPSMLMQYCIEKPVRTKLVLVGSAAEYGDIPCPPEGYNETQGPSPNTDYGFSKSMQFYAMHYYAKLGVSVVLARIFNLRSNRLKDDLFLGSLNRQIEEFFGGKRTAIELGELNVIRDYLPADIAAEMIVTLAHRGVSGEVYNIASGNGICLEDLVISELSRYNLSRSVIRNNRARISPRSVGCDVSFANMERFHRLTFVS